MATILLTGAAGYIGSHTWLALQSAGFRVVGLDDFSNSSPKVLDRLQSLSGQVPVFERASITDAAALDAVFGRHAIDAVVHFAAFKAVGESGQKPLDYYANNIGGLLATCQAMQRHGVKKLVFSSSATVYGEPQYLPYDESHPLSAINVYGRTKLYGEQILRDVAAADPAWSVAWLRYFNPVGAHESGRIGEDPRGIPNNLMPYVAQVAVGRREHLQVFGGDYDTPDGTGVRDYLHVMDLADGHVAALRHLLDGRGSITANLGTGRGHSVLELVQAYERASGRPIPYRIVDRRPGDLASSWADPRVAREQLGWQTTRDLDAMCADSWRWQSANPQGYD
ncbi:UDP-glucose 4-epimerase GalE [Ideonella sp.]|uniref:UDP-glucose 4-epimerase GalE n=1 Tax=Ideonella sp. TaxID=1929293 RepID=UPI0035B20545